MPTISMFFGILIRMYYDDHNPPHFHAFYNENHATFTFDGKILEGKFPKKELKLVEAWSIIHKKELEANWLLAKNCEKLYNIKPLS
ncbi:MAG: DUF4160 domain-containing protein [Clostridia bacterium]|nr:DUF4160 domain-containing protein [Clostridia bacterium]